MADKEQQQGCEHGTMIFSSSRINCMGHLMHKYRGIAGRLREQPTHSIMTGLSFPLPAPILHLPLALFVPLRPPATRYNLIGLILQFTQRYQLFLLEDGILGLIQTGPLMIVRIRW